MAMNIWDLIKHQSQMPPVPMQDNREPFLPSPRAISSTENVPTEAGMVPTAPPPMQAPRTPESGINAQIRALLLASIKRRQERLADTQSEMDALKNYKEKPDLFRGLAKAYDVYTGGKTNTASMFPEAMTDKEKQALMAKLKGAAVKQEENISDEQLGLLKQQLSLGKLDPAREYKLGKDIMSYNKHVDNLNKKLEEQFASFGSIKDLITEARAGNAVAFNSVGTKMARAMGEVGVLTDKDVVRYIDTEKITLRLANKFRKWKAGKPTDLTLDEIEKIADIMQDSFVKRRERMARKHVNRLVQNYGVTRGDAWLKLGYDAPEEIDSVKAPEKDTTKKQKPAGTFRSQYSASRNQTRFLDKEGNELGVMDGKFKQ